MRLGVTLHQEAIGGEACLMKPFQLLNFWGCVYIKDHWLDLSLQPKM